MPLTYPTELKLYMILKSKLWDDKEINLYFVNFIVEKRRDSDE